jgi:carbohydrate-selective porin OprB
MTIVYDTLMEAGKDLGVTNAGHYAINSLRLEKGYRAWGAELSPDDTALEAGLSFAIDWSKEFVGREALLKQKQAGVKRRLLIFVLDDPEPTLWGSEPIYRDGKPTGYTTSGSYGHTVGAAIEWYRGAWTLRGGLFDMSDVPNSAHLDPGFHEFQSIVEVERRHAMASLPGRLALTIYKSHARMGLLDDAVQFAESTGSAVDIAAVRSYRTRAGASLNLEQQIAPDLGLFARLGKAAGDVEAYEFADIDRAVSIGLSVQGNRWHRPDDTLGLAAIDNAISASRERYLNAGGLGILVGDGRLPHPGPEQIVETYYSLAMLHFAHLSFDYQWINHPAYNRDRGPVSVVAVRLHAQF